MTQAGRRIVYRREVFERQKDLFHGPVMIGRPLGSWILVSGAAAISAVLLLYLVLGTYTPRTVASGQLVPETGLIQIVPPGSGSIVEKRVHEGQKVAEGDVLFVVADERRRATGGGGGRIASFRENSLVSRAASLRRKRAAVQELAAQSELLLQQQVGSIEDEQVRNRQEMELLSARVQSALEMVERHRMLARSNFISDSALKDREDQYGAARSQLLASQRSAVQLDRGLLTAKGDLRQLPARTHSQLADLDKELAEIEQIASDSEGRDRYAITAPAGGTVTAITADVGQAVSSQAIATIVPHAAKLIARVYVASRSTGFLQVGQPVRIRFNAFPYQKYGQHKGVVTEITQSPVNEREATSRQEVKAAVLYRVDIKLERDSIRAYDKDIPLVAGSELEADIEQESRRLVDWVLDPLLAAGRSL